MDACSFPSAIPHSVVRRGIQSKLKDVRVKAELSLSSAGFEFTHKSGWQLGTRVRPVYVCAFPMMDRCIRIQLCQLEDNTQNTNSSCEVGQQ